MEKSITFGKRDYLINEELGKLSFIIDNDGIETKLTTEYCANAFGKDECFTYALSEGKLYSLDLPSPNKSLKAMGLTREEYVAHGKPPIFYKAPVGQILQTQHDLFAIFADKKEYSYNQAA